MNETLNVWGYFKPIPHEREEFTLFVDNKTNLILNL